ncbi:MAG: phosphatase PAP2 family protein [Longimicrobiales bacterium]
MKTRWAIVLLAGSIFRPDTVRAQSVGHDLENGFKDFIYIWTAPTRLRPGALPELGAVLAASAALLPLDEPLYNWLSKHPRSLPGTVLGVFGEDLPLARIGRTYVLVPVSLLLYTAGWVSDKPSLRQAGMGCISSNLSTTLTRNVLNRVLGRLRPVTKKGAFEFRPFLFRGSTWDTRSFPGGHGGHIMSCASFWSNRFDLGLGEPLLYAAALGVGWARVMDGAHWPSDTFFGQVYGWAVGKAVADRYLQRAERNEARTGAGVGFTIRIPL